MAGRHTYRYIYAIARCTEPLDLGRIGIEGNRVYAIPCQGISAIVHDCPPEPYSSGDDAVVRAWVKTHQAVIDEVTARLGQVIPMGFDTMVRAPDEAGDEARDEARDEAQNEFLSESSCGARDATDAVVAWLAEDRGRLIAILQSIEGKDEYAVKIYYDPKTVAEMWSAGDEAVKRLRDDIAGKSPGLAYMYRQRLEKVVKSGVEAYVAARYESIYSRVKEQSDDVVVDKGGRREGDAVLLMNLSCLVRRDRVEALGTVLEDVESSPGFSVRFSGPWPAYSFVAKVAPGSSLPVD